MKYDTQQLGLIFIKAVEGSHEHSREFIDAITPYIRKMLILRKVNRNDIDDIIQDVFIRLFTQGKAFDPQKGTITVWVSIVTSRTVIDRYRRNKKHKDNVPLLGDVEQKDDKLSKRAYLLFPTLSRAMSQREHDFVKLHFFQGHSYEECSRAMNLPLGTMKSAVHRMYSNLRKTIEEEGVLVQ